MSEYILAIDPGCTESAYVVVDKNLKPFIFGKINNHDLLSFVQQENVLECVENFAIEMVACYGMAVGKEIFDTCVWIGRFWEVTGNIQNKSYIYRKEEKMNLCGSMKAKDTNIRQALIDRFGIVGVKKSPGWFYGFHSDIWAAYAVAVTYHDKYKAKSIV